MNGFRQLGLAHSETMFLTPSFPIIYRFLNPRL
jgi:hypothetical protein